MWMVEVWPGMETLKSASDNINVQTKLKTFLEEKDDSLYIF